MTDRGGPICPGCGASLSEARAEGGWLDCAGCERRYPLVRGRIPVLMPDPVLYLACLYLQHDRYLRRQASRIAALRAAVDRYPERAQVLAEIADALDWNRALIEAAAAELASYLTPVDLTRALDAPSFVAYSTTLEYLERDWCWLPAGEEELGATLGAMLGCIEEHAPGLGSVLVLGAGTGRIAWELTERFQRVYALDAALTMAQRFHDVMDGGVSFYAVSTCSMVSSADLVRRREAVPVSPGAAAGGALPRSGDLSYLVGDLAALPLPAGSAAVVASVYCTDVMPLDCYLDELNRVIEPGGLFLHFGPLEYHFDDISRHLSAAEVRSAFEAEGFATVKDEHLELRHLSAEGSMAPRVFDNWVFGAVRR